MQTPSNNSLPLRLAVLISGGGTTLRNLIDKIAQGEFQAEISVVVSSSSKAKGLDYATAAEIPAHVVTTRQYPEIAEFSEAIFEICRAAEVDYVIMGGFLKLVQIPEDFENRVLNIHPSLIPAFAGHGFYGERVHQAVLDRGAKITGCTVHFVDNQYDHGPIILQRAVPVLEGDTAASLAKRVFETECDAYVEAIKTLPVPAIKR